MGTLYIDGEPRNIMRISEEEKNDMIYCLAKKILIDGLPIDKIVYVLRGAMIPSRNLGDALDVDNLSSIKIEKYGKNIGKTIRKKPRITEDITAPLGGLYVLGFDEVQEYGNTVDLLKRRLKQGNPKRLARGKPKKVLTSSMVIKPWTIDEYRPDYWVRMVDKWCVFPGEEMEFIRKVKKSNQERIKGFDDSVLGDLVSPYLDEVEINRYFELEKIKLEKEKSEVPNPSLP